MADYLSSREQNIPKKYKNEYMHLANHLKILFSNDLELKKFISDELKLNQSDITFEFDFSKSENAELIIPTIIFRFLLNDSVNVVAVGIVKSNKATPINIIKISILSTHFHLNTLHFLNFPTFITS